jgi:uncharacterized protein (TIGR00725 family)
LISRVQKPKIDGLEDANCMKRLIGVIGGSEASPEILGMAEEMGRLIARSGSLLICGGLGGVMEASCRGAREEGGLTLGILPGPLKEDANEYVEIALATDLGYARNAIIAQASDVLIAIGGRFGTLSEIAFSLALGKRVVGLATWDCDPAIIQAKSPEDALARALEP